MLSDVGVVLSMSMTTGLTIPFFISYKNYKTKGQEAKETILKKYNPSYETVAGVLEGIKRALNSRTISFLYDYPSAKDKLFLYFISYLFPLADEYNSFYSTDPVVRSNDYVYADNLRVLETIRKGYLNEEDNFSQENIMSVSFKIYSYLMKHTLDSSQIKENWEASEIYHPDNISVDFNAQNLNLWGNVYLILFSLLDELTNGSFIEAIDRRPVVSADGLLSLMEDVLKEIPMYSPIRKEVLVITTVGVPDEYEPGSDEYMEYIEETIPQILADIEEIKNIFAKYNNVPIKDIKVSKIKDISEEYEDLNEKMRKLWIYILQRYKE